MKHLFLENIQWILFLSRKQLGRTRTSELAILRNANSWAVQRGQEGHQVSVLVMVVDKDAKNQVVTRALRVERPTVRLMVEERGVST